MTYDLIDRTVRRANPVPDPARLDHKPPLALGTLAPEGLTMQLIERPTDQRTPDDPRRSRWVLLAGAAAAVAAAFLVGVIVANRDAEPTPPADSVAPVETLEAVPPVEPTLLTQMSALAPGEYRIDTDGDPATSTSATLTAGGERWFSLQTGVVRDKPNPTDEYSFALFVAEVDRVNVGGCATRTYVGEGGGVAAQWTDVGGVQQLAEALAGMQEVVLNEPLAPTSAFGFPAYHLTVGVPACPERDAYLAWEGPTWGREYDRGMTVEYWALDVDGTTVLVEAGWHADSSVDDRTALWDAIGTLQLTP